MHSGSASKNIIELATAISRVLAPFSERLTQEQRDLAAVAMTIRYTEAVRLAASAPNNPIGNAMGYTYINRALGEKLLKDLAQANVPSDITQEIANAADKNLMSYLVQPPNVALR